MRDLWREVRAVAGGATEAHHRLRRRVATAVVATLIVDLVGSGLMYLFEHDAPHTEITSAWTATFWVTAQLLTVSSQLRNPLTGWGRVVDVGLELWAVIVVAGSAGAIAAFFQKSDA